MTSSAATILVVDDEPDLRTLYELTLLREGYRVETAGTLGEARTQLQERRFDAVITDMRLPDGLGLELLLALRRQQRPERCIVMTAYGSAENAVESLKAGAFDYLTKPVDLKQFRSIVASAVQPSAYLVRNVQYDQIEHVVDAILPTAEQAHWLQMAADQPCLMLTRRTWLRGVPITWVHCVHPGMRYRLGSRFRTDPVHGG